VNHALPPGWRLRIHASLPSTSDLLLRLAADGEPGGLAVLAHRQTAGRGRDGRPWRSEPGNLHLSLLLRPEGTAREAHQWGLLAAVALHDALAAWAPDPEMLVLKWPNDVMLGGAKLAGILCESAADAAGRLEWLVIGLGANLSHAPSVPGRATASLPLAPGAEAMAAAVLERFAHWQSRQLAEGFAAIRVAWMARGPAQEAPLILRGGLAGGYRGLGDNGSLLLAAGGVVHAVLSGEVD